MRTQIEDNINGALARFKHFVGPFSTAPSDWKDIHEWFAFEFGVFLYNENKEKASAGGK